MVSAKGTSVCDRHLQRRNEYGRDSGAPHRAVDHFAVRMAVGIHCDRTAWSSLVDSMACNISPAAGTPQAQAFGAGLHSKRSQRILCSHSMVTTDSSPADVGLPDR